VTRGAGLLLTRSANREIRRAAEGADQYEGHRHHEQDAIEKSGCPSLSRGVVFGETVLARGTRENISRHEQYQHHCQQRQGGADYVKKSRAKRFSVHDVILGQTPTGGQRWYSIA